MMLPRRASRNASLKQVSAEFRVNKAASRGPTAVKQIAAGANALQ